MYIKVSRYGLAFVMHELSRTATAAIAVLCSSRRIVTTFQEGRQTGRRFGSCSRGYIVENRLTGHRRGFASNFITLKILLVSRGGASSTKCLVQRPKQDIETRKQRYLFDTMRRNPILHQNRPMHARYKGGGSATSTPAKEHGVKYHKFDF